MADVTLTEQKKALLLEAIYEIDKLSRVLPGLVPVDEDQTHYAVKGVAGRMVRLSNALLSGLDDEHATEDDLKQVIRFEQAGHA